MKKISIAITLFFIVLSSGVFFIARTYPPGVSGAMGPGFFPMIIAGIIIFLSVLVLRNTLKHSDNTASSSSAVKINVTVLLSLVILLVYILAMRILGFSLGSFLFLFGLMKFFKTKGLILPVVISVCTTVILYSIFTMFLSVQLPRSILF